LLGFLVSRSLGGRIQMHMPIGIDQVWPGIGIVIEELGAKGQEALAVVAQVLNDNPNLKIYVVGHTDSVKVTKGFTDNWSLSTERANSVVRVLRDQYQVTMDRVTSAGQGKYDPVADNSTPEGRAKNRRTDIILNPDLSRFWEMIDKQP